MWKRKHSSASPVEPPVEIENKKRLEAEMSALIQKKEEFDESLKAYRIPLKPSMTKECPEVEVEEIQPPHTPEPQVEEEEFFYEEEEEQEMFQPSE
ncbi:hypothetical protein NDU88_005626 [Pleurodeles waltl]|uniref:Uncharacterized protein n=1 Tax=Pleurodeles waltl TaxID=8319 RepID=A0AAV7QFA2_PLEWA|nr:hypothetical protein NDU88_005626 [Pleurodeles waltl]